MRLLLIAAVMLMLTGCYFSSIRYIDLSPQCVESDEQRCV